MANSQLGISYFDKNVVFATCCGRNSYGSSQWLPSFGVPMNTIYGKKSKWLRISSSRTRGYGKICALSSVESDSGSGVIDKEFEFKPSFDGYLKAMELAKIGKQKKLDYGSNRDGLKHNLSKKDGSERLSLGRDEEITPKEKKIEGNFEKQRVSKAMNSIKFKNRKGGDEERNVRKLKFDSRGKESRMDSVKARVSNATESIEFKNRRGSNEERNIRKLKYDSLGKESRMDFVKSRMDSVKSRMDLGQTTDRKWIKQRPPGHVELVTDIIPRRAHVNAVVLGDSNVKNNLDTNLYRNVSSSKLLQRRTGTGLRVNHMDDRSARNHIDVEEDSDEEISPKHQKPRRTKKQSFTVEEDNALEVVERAAFKTSDLDEFVYEPRVTQREMEDRVQLLAKRLNGADIDMPEWMFSQTMRSAKIKFTDRTILRTIQLLGKLGNWRRVLQVIEWLQTRDRFKSFKLRNVYTTALDALGKARRPVEALNVFHAMQLQMSTYPDIVAYRCIAVTLGQAGHMKELFDVIDSMRSPPKKKFKTVLEEWDPRLEPDIVVYNSVLNACAQRKNWEGAFWVLQQLKEKGQQPSTTTYGLVMEVMFGCGKYNLVHEFFKKMQKSSIPNALAYRVLVNTLWKEGKTDEAVLAVQDMERRGVVGSAALYYDLARCLCSAGRCKEALEQIDNICKVANKPLVVTYTGLIQACLDAGNVQNAVFIFNQMKAFCSPNVVTYNIMLKAYLEHGLFDEAKALFQKMLEDGKHMNRESDYQFRVTPDIYTFNTMLDACVEKQRWDDLVFVYARMLQNGYHFNSKRHLGIVMKASRAGKEELLETTWKHLAQTDRNPPPPLTKERFCVKLAKADPISALCCVSSQPESELQAFSRGAWLRLFKDNAQRFSVDSLMVLLDEVTVAIAKSKSSSLVLQNLLTSCREYLRTSVSGAENNLHESVYTVESALKYQ